VDPSLGVLWPLGSQVKRSNGDVNDVYSGGPGFDIRGGVQFTTWLALDLNLVAQTLILVGDGRAGAMLEIVPVDYLAFSSGSGVGSLYTVNFVHNNIVVDFAYLAFRIEGRLRQKSTWWKYLTFGAEGLWGSSFESDIPAHRTVVGGRLILNFLWH